MNFKLLSFAYNYRVVFDYFYILHYYHHHQQHHHHCQQPITRFPYFTAVQLFLRTERVSLTNHFLFTALPKPF